MVCNLKPGILFLTSSLAPKGYYSVNEIEKGLGGGSRYYGCGV
jgi:hypothetical protein